jgi:RelA/SpoT family (p)ppGpp synthetase
MTPADHPTSEPAISAIAPEHLRLIWDMKDQIRGYVRKHGQQTEVELLEHAFEDIELHHANQVRRSGQPVVIHPLRVALSICDMGLDAPTVVASLLHDSIEDTSITRAYIAERYGEWYAEIVDGLTKIKHPPDSGKKGADLEATYQKMLIAMVRDIRSLFIKLFDRLDNMKDMESMPRHKQRRISRETLNVYVPMARRFGLEELSQEHTELCFRYLYPKRYARTLDQLRRLREKQSEAVQHIRERIQQMLAQPQLEQALVEEVWTHPASYVHRSESVDHILEGFRIIVQEPLQSYLVLGALHMHGSAVPLKIRDFISNPLWDGYQGLQTQVIIEGEPISFEIVSQQMRETNEHGIMAFWKGTPGELSEYYRACLKQLDLVAESKELRMADVMRYVQSDQIQVFTPRGDVITLPVGATILDFAYHIHTDLGNHCVGGLVNAPRAADPDQASHRWVPRERKLQHGESVRIVTQKDLQPERNWLEQSVTARSHLNIRRQLRQQNGQKATKVGMEYLRRELLRFQLQAESWLQQENVQRAFEQERLTAERFLEELGLQKRDLRGFLKNHQLIPIDSLPRIARFRTWFRTKSVPTFRVEDEHDTMIHLCECCHPIPGDRTVGIPNDQKEIEIHRPLCPELPVRKGTPPMIVHWRLPEGRLRSYKLCLTTVEDRGILFQITRVIKDAGVAILDSKSHQRTATTAYIEVTLEPISWRVFHRIVERLRAMKFVKQVW